MSVDKTLLQVAAKAAITNTKGQVLIVREAASGKNNVNVGEWGLVGGRLEPGEQFYDALEREILEETGLRVTVEKPLYVGEWHPVIRGVPHQIVAIFMHCKATTTTVKLSEEHDKFAWVEPSQRHQYNMVEPDCFVVDGLCNSPV